MIPLSKQHYSLLKTLAAEPWLTADQLATWAQVSAARTYVHLRSMMQRGMVQRVNSKSARTELRGVYALTDRAVRALAEFRNIAEHRYRTHYQLTRTRHTEILWQLERVCAVRDFLLRFSAGGLTLGGSITLADVGYKYRGKSKTIRLHAIGQLVGTDGFGLPFAVEWDLPHLPLDHKRMQQLAEWLSGFDEFGTGRNVPMLLWVAANRGRLERLWDLLQTPHQHPAWRRSAVYLTTAEHLATKDPQEAIWLNALRNRWERWAENEPRRPVAQCGYALQPSVSQARIGRFGKNSESKRNGSGMEELLALKLHLSAQAKRVLQRVANRPFLTVTQVAWLQGENADRVGKALQELVTHRLVEPFRHRTTRRYRLTQRGTRYETAEAGYGRAIQQYHRACGGRSGLKRLEFHLAHTIAINEFFMRWLRLARTQNVRFDWVSELESARFFKYGSRWHRFLPDGKGVWHSPEGAPFRFVLEMDRTRESAQNLRAKFKTYLMWRLWRQQHRSEPAPHVLVVTTSWTQADTIRRVMQEAVGWFEGPYVMWLTTHALLERWGMEGAIWRLNIRGDELSRLPCFATLPA